MAGNDEVVAELVDTFSGLPLKDQTKAVARMAQAMLAHRHSLSPHGSQLMKVGGPGITVAMGGGEWAGILDTAYGAMKKAMGIREGRDEREPG